MKMSEKTKKKRKLKKDSEVRSRRARDQDCAFVTHRKLGLTNMYLFVVLSLGEEEDAKEGEAQ
jgi:hypothetical protein